MVIREADERKYSKLDLHELARLVTSFLIPYPFVRAVHLCPGREQGRPYHLLFEVPVVPLEAKELYIQFNGDLSWPSMNFEHGRVYRNKEASIKDADEWMWWQVSDAKDIEGEALQDFVLSDEGVCLYERPTVFKDNGNPEVTSENQSDYFPELRLSELQYHARRWAGKFRGVRRICLFNYVPDHFAVYKQVFSNWDVRYVLVFELQSDIKTEELQELEAVTVQWEPIHMGYPALFDNRFFVVYLDKPEDDYAKHWTIRLCKAGEASPPGVLSNEGYWMLWSSSTKEGVPFDDRQRSKPAPKRRRGPKTGAKLESKEPLSEAPQRLLTGRKEIAKYLGLSWPTIRRYQKKFALPIRYTPTNRPVAVPEDLKSWLNEFQAKKKKK